MERLVFAAAMLAGFAFSSAASASELSYDYLEFGYNQPEFSGVEGDGFEFDSRISTGPTSFVNIGYRALTIDGSGAELTIDDFTLGLNGRNAADGPADFVYGAGFLHRRAEFSGTFFRTVSDSDTGFYGTIGLRSLLGANAEGYANATYYSVLEESDLRFNIGMAFGFDAAAFVVEYESEPDLDTLTFGVRFKF